MIKLSKRLECIANVIDEKDFVLDIGCDHALLDIFLSKKYNKTYYASDIKKSALEIARKNISKYNAKKVIIKCGNGLEVLEKDINTLILSGMGDITITNILRNINNIKQINKIVIESNTNTNNVRKFIIKNGFYIDKEVVVLDNNFYYIIGVYKRGHKYYSNIDKEIGVLEGNLKDYYNQEIKKNIILLKLIPNKYILKKLKIKRILKYLKIKKEFYEK